jgi:hypothetical protein
MERSANSKPRRQSLLEINQSGLTPRQRRFVEEYLVDLNATQAAIRAGYSARTANEQGARLLANASVAAVVQSAQLARSERIQLVQDDVLRGLYREATRMGDGSSHSARVTAWVLGKHLGMFDRPQESPQLFTISITSGCGSAVPQPIDGEVIEQP